MCFSPEVDFIASGVIALIGVATLAHVQQPRAVLFAATPIFFALHQFTEGFIWLGLEGQIRPEAQGHLVFLYMLYAQGILPLLMPLAVLLMEPPGRRRWLIAGLTLLGAALAAFVFRGLIVYPSTACIERHSIHYDNPGTALSGVAVLYVLATCGALILSSHRVVRWFGSLNFVGVIATLIAKGYAFTSVWCLYAAIASLILFWQFRARRINVSEPNASLVARATG
ncbi:hypothetical protein MMSR116_06525 [Methylobacterium mesophilicum SR1.6/6]|uniref:Uncharacterized protein n=1 Tax=Methylobacterium mesophilicum SR1.6/6 TaxID=908290 RepID=A0A6B9FIJ9_9HYPH|nr:DUF6629 family protein [Methylobacterium mesophilicum]QGY01596.1 hypothetical protein MMSR116_06525 [Methylobacterium mesophilicum SR1.6/6]